LAGFGVGHLLTATNLIIGERNAHRRGSGLTLLNAFFSAGAILSSLVIGNLALHLILPQLVLGFAACFALVFAGFVTHNLQTRSSAAILSDNTQSSASQQFPGINLRVLLFFAAMLFLYGGVETSINSWISTYTVRYGSAALWLGVASASAFWIAITAGRAISVAMLARVSERMLLCVSLAATAFALCVVIFVHTGWQIAAASLLTGLCLAPVFPTNFSLLLAQRPRARQAGSILAVSGLGAAFLPWATGIVSTHTLSLQAGLMLPLLATLALLALSLVMPRSANS
jgi:fucose permease